MATKDEVIALHRRNPTWTAREIADALDCHPAYVRSTAARYKFKLPKHEEPREKAYRMALEFYANASDYELSLDSGQKAKEALARWR